jgi:hypothetical protein
MTAKIKGMKEIIDKEKIVSSVPINSSNRRKETKIERIAIPAVLNNEFVVFIIFLFILVNEKMNEPTNH